MISSVIWITLILLWRSICLWDRVFRNQPKLFLRKWTIPPTRKGVLGSYFWNIITFVKNNLIWDPQSISCIKTIGVKLFQTWYNVSCFLVFKKMYQLNKFEKNTSILSETVKKRFYFCCCCYTVTKVKRVGIELFLFFFIH